MRLSRFRVYGAGVLLLATLMAVGGNGARAGACDDALSNADRRECLDRAIKQADRRLNQNYQALIKASDAEGQALLRTAQRAWIAFRDAECLWRADLMRGGSEAPLLSLDCIGALTSERVRQLELALKAYGER